VCGFWRPAESPHVALAFLHGKLSFLSHPRLVTNALPGPLLNKEFKGPWLLVESFIQRCVRDGTIVVGGDGWSDRLMKSVNYMLLFVPQPPLYVEIKVWWESRHTAESTTAFFATRIDSFGPRNVCDGEQNEGCLELAAGVLPLDGDDPVCRPLPGPCLC